MKAKERREHARQVTAKFKQSYHGYSGRPDKNVFQKIRKENR